MPARLPKPARHRSRAPLWLRVGFWICIAISVAVVLRRIYALAAPARNAPPELAAVLLFNTLFLFSLGLAWTHRRRGDMALERRWQLRAIAILLGIATTRPVMGIFFATARLTHLVPQQFFGIAFWIGFSVNVLVFELWIRSVDRHRNVEFRSTRFGSVT